MRELKFRAWHRKDKVMWWWNILWGNCGHGSGWIGMLPVGEEKKYRGMDDNRTQVDPDDCEIMQFTGWTDKNGIDIYEGDIVKAKWHWEEPHTIVWVDDVYDLMEYALEGEDLEVIGNIHEGEVK
jgi:uncharacterized phage protein (TIGR01671 family)